jgi:hypothetical protein
LAWHGNPWLHAGILVTGAGLFLLIPILWGVNALRRRWNSTLSVFVAAPLPRYCMLSISLCYVAFMLLIVFGDPAWVLGKFVWMNVIFLLPVVAAILTGINVIVLLRQWRPTAGSWRFRLMYPMFTVVSVIFVWWLHYWNLLGWHM